MCDSCNTTENIDKLGLLLNTVFTSTPQLHWLYNGFNKFRSQLPDNIVDELETQLLTLAKTVGASNYKLSVISSVVTYIVLFIVVLFLFLCSIFNNRTLKYILMAISLILIIVGVLGILWYTNNNINEVSMQITSTTNNFKTVLRNALDAGLCCVNGLECGSCPGGCACDNIPIFTFNVVVNGLTITLTDITEAPIFPIAGRQWDFGNGTKTNGGSTISYTYPKAGTYNVTLTYGLSGGICNFSACEPLYIITSPPTAVTVT